MWLHLREPDADKEKKADGSPRTPDLKSASPSTQRPQKCICLMSSRREKGRGEKIWKVTLSFKKDSTIATQLKYEETMIVYICIVTAKYYTQVYTLLTPPHPSGCACLQACLGAPWAPGSRGKRQETSSPRAALGKGSGSQCVTSTVLPRVGTSQQESYMGP